MAVLFFFFLVEVLFFLGTLYGVDRKPNVLGLVSAWFKPLRWAAREKGDGLGLRRAISAHSSRLPTLLAGL
jgi:hypothetical protein